jgi:hypothetical protein
LEAAKARFQQKSAKAKADRKLIVTAIKGLLETCLALSTIGYEALGRLSDQLQGESAKLQGSTQPQLKQLRNAVSGDLDRALVTLKTHLDGAAEWTRLAETAGSRSIAVCADAAGKDFEAATLVVQESLKAAFVESAKTLEELAKGAQEPEQGALEERKCVMAVASEAGSSALLPPLRSARSALQALHLPDNVSVRIREIRTWQSSHSAAAGNGKSAGPLTAIALLSDVVERLGAWNVDRPVEPAGDDLVARVQPTPEKVSRYAAAMSVQSATSVLGALHQGLVVAVASADEEVRSTLEEIEKAKAANESMVTLRSTEQQRAVVKEVAARLVDLRAVVVRQGERLSGARLAVKFAQECNAGAESIAKAVAAANGAPGADPAAGADDKPVQLPFQQVRQATAGMEAAAGRFVGKVAGSESGPVVVDVSAEYVEAVERLKDALQRLQSDDGAAAIEVAVKAIAEQRRSRLEQSYGDVAWWMARAASVASLLRRGIDRMERAG